MSERARPVVKWAGGKARLLPTLVAQAPSRFRRYYEPFLGGGALFFHLAPGCAIVGDANAALMAMYRALAEEVESVLEELHRLRAEHCDAHYYAVRERFNAGGQPPAERAALLLYLNKTCFNGLWRVNRRGGFNVPIGRYKAPQIFDPAALRAAARALAEAELRAADFRDTVADALPGDLVYFDPPYHPSSRTARFTSYTSNGFGEKDQVELAELAARLAARGCAVLVSNSDTAFIRSLYCGFRRTTLRVARSLSANVRRRGPVPELLFAAGFPPTKGAL